MTAEEIVQFFEDNESLSHTFDAVENKRSTRPDLHAMLLLDDLCPGTWDMVSAAEHDQIWLEADVETVAAKASEEQLLELIRCGVHICDGEAFSMFA